MSGPLLAVPADALLALRTAMLSRPDLDTVFALRDAGYAGGNRLYDAFDAYVREKDLVDPQDLEAGHFFHRAGEFWSQNGWGRTTFSAHEDGYCMVEMSGCWEADAEMQPDPRGCHLTLGLLGAFLGRFADYPLAVLEIEGPASGSERCRFLAGSMDRVAEYYAAHS